MKPLSKLFLFGVIMFFATGITVSSWAHDDHRSNKVKWERIVGILAPGANVGGFLGVPGPWTAEGGRASVDLSSGKVHFRVRGLVLAFQPGPAPSGPTPIIGTSGLASEVKGTLVCDASAIGTVPPPASSFVDTPAVPISPQGDAEFHGFVAIPAACLVTPEKLAFLVRVANASAIVDRWIGFGASREP